MVSANCFMTFGVVLSWSGPSPRALASSGIEGFDRVLGGGFPVPSAVLVEGPLGGGKEPLLYSFVRKSEASDRCVYITRSGVSEVVRDARANGVEFTEDMTWIAGQEGEVRIELENLASLSFSIKEILRKNSGTSIRLVVDVLSSLLMRNDPEAVYRFLDQLIVEVKKYQAVLLATIESGMHPPSVVASLEHLFDGVIVVEPEEGHGPAIKIKRMKGIAAGSAQVILLSGGQPKSAVPQEERRLAAIMFTDIVGYTAITQRDESRAMEILKGHNALLRPIFLKHQGREVKTIGDAFLLEFGSALRALQCAIEVQETLFNFNKSATIEEEKVRLRIGIHLGDVIIRDKDVFGDAVNIASRIQPLAEPGGICVSDQVYGQVRNKIPYELVKTEQVKLKNVLNPVDVYHVFLPWEPRPKVKAHAPEAGVPLTRRLAILPFVNRTADAKDDFLADGMSEELITSLSNVKDLRVIASSSVVKYKGTTKVVSEIASELGVGCLVEGSVMKHGDKIRVHVVMVDGKSEEHLFATTYDRDIQDIFAVQSEIAKLVSRAVKAKLRAIEKERIEKKPTESVDAYSTYLQGRYVLNKRTKQSMEEAVLLFIKAIALDTGFAKAEAGLADTYLLMGSYGYLDTKQAYVVAKEHVTKALGLDDDLAEAHVSLGFLLETYYYDYVAARKEYEKAISISPSYAQARHWYGMNLLLFGERDEAAGQMEKALEIDPLSAQIATMLANVYVMLDRKDEALFQWNRALMSSPENVPAYLNRGIFYAEEGRRVEALSDLNRALELTSGAVVVKCILALSHAILGDRDEALQLLQEVELASQKEYVSPWYIAIVHAGLGNNDEFFVWAGKAIDDRSAEIATLVNPDKVFDRLTSDPRYEALLKKAGLPLTYRVNEVVAPAQSSA
jgi:adenylate cyclase